MKSVSRFEAAMLRILRAFLGRVPMEQAQPLLYREHPRPKCLSRACVELMEDSLTKGTVYLMAREGWQRERFLRSGQVRAGRLWERTAPGELGLTFSRQTMELLIWMTAENFPEVKSPAFDGPLTTGDRLLYVLAAQAIGDAGLEKLEPVLEQIPPYSDDGLYALATPQGRVQTPDHWRPDFSAWLVPPGSCILEAWQARLAQAWFQGEQAKRRIVDPQQLFQQGQRQDRTLSAFLDACEKAGRRDLARFLLAAGRQVMAEPLLADEYFRQLDTKGQRMADRTATYQMGLALLRHFDRLNRWQQDARAVAHYDDEYAASQLWKSDWETYDGDELSLRARQTIAALNPLHT